MRWSTAFLSGGFVGLGVLYLHVGSDSDDDEPDQSCPEELVAHSEAPGSGR